MNYYYLLIPLLLSIIVIIILYSQNKKRKKSIEKLIFEKHDLEVLRKNELKDYFEEEWKKGENELELRLSNKREAIKSESTKLESDFQISKTELNALLRQMEVQLKEKEKRYNEVNQDLNLYKEGKIKEIDAGAQEYEQRKRLLVDSSIDKYRDFQLTNANNQMAVTKEEIDKINEELKEITVALEEERKKRAAVNEEIRRQKEIEMEQDFYRIQFSEEDKNDVEILRSVAPRLRHPEAINKVIWSAYYQKPLAELRKRLLPNGDVSCVYKATRLKTGEIYIGQTTSFDKRLQEHTRSALGIGSLASSQLHKKMLEDGPENYLWQILEVVPKDKLRERESYYIDFYDSKTYGLNSVTGDKK